ncbi:MAG: polymer-forming cytoskeletal protein, partial [Myxococcota bacterium]
MADIVTQIGEGTRIAGHVSGDEDLSVLGTIEGSIALSQVLYVEPSGRIEATTIEARSAVVAGAVEGSLTLAETLTVDPGGQLKADIETTTAIISGTVVGNITARERLEITSGGCLVGDVTTARLVMADGATLKGRIAMAGLEEEPMPEASRDADTGRGGGRGRA